MLENNIDEKGCFFKPQKREVSTFLLCHPGTFQGSRQVTFEIKL